jgi:hypothetical protein
MSMGKWASGARALKGTRACGGGWRMRRHGRIHSGSVGERLGKRRELTGGVHGAARGDLRTGGQH